MSFHILADSCCDLPTSLTETYSDFSMLVFSFIIDGELGSPDLPIHDFYQKLHNGSMSQTSQIAPDIFTETYQKIFDSGQNEILYVGFSSGLSGTYENAKIAAEEFPLKPGQKIITVDTLSASMGLGFIVNQAVQRRAEGMSLEETAAWLEANKLKVNHWFTVDDLNYLKRGGRVSAGAAWFGGVMNVKPVMNMDDAGKLIPREKKIGRGKAIKGMAEKVESMAVEPQKQTIFVSQGDCMEDAETLMALVRESLGVENFVVSDIGPVIGSHTGPGVLAIFFMGNNR